MSESEQNQQLSPFIRPVPKYIIDRDSGSNETLSQEGFGGNSNQGLVHLFHIWLRYRTMILGITGVVFVLSLLYNLLAQRLYTAEATLKIGTYAPLLQGTQLEDVLRQQTREQDYLDTQIELLSSRSLADRVLQDPEVGQSVSDYLRKRRGLFDFFSSSNDSAVSNKSDAANDPALGGSYQHSIKVLKRYVELVKVAPVRKTSLVKVAATTSNPQLSAQIANAHATLFIQHVRDERQRGTVENLVFLKNQAQELGDKVAALERNIASYAEENAIISLNKDENVTVKRMSELNQLLTEAAGKRIKSETLYKEANSGSGISSAAFDDQSILDLRVQLKQAESEYAQLSQKFKSEYPSMVQLRAKISALKTNLDQQRGEVLRGLEAQFKADLESEKALQEELEIQQSKAFDLSRREVQYNIMKREYESTRDLHQSVLRQLKEAQVSSESNGSNITLSDLAAVPIEPSSPRPVRNSFLALLIGLIGGIGVALLLDILDNTLSSPEEVQDTLGLPVLGVVPLFALSDAEAKKSASPGDSSRADDEQSGPQLATSDGREIAIAQSRVVTVDSPGSVASEAFRTIRTGILLSSADHPPKIILVTSGKKSEGKTTLATNLAAAMCQASYSTIIVDADLRRPALHKAFNVDRDRKGLVDLLTGQAELSDVVMQTNVPKLFCISAGIVPPNPAELIGSKRMAELLQTLAQIYDYVIVDAPPVLPVTDSVLLSRVVDGVVLVVRGEDTPKHVAREASQRLLRSGARVLGVVLNDVDFKRGDYYYYYRDSYSYYDRDPKKERKSRKAAAA